MMKILHTVSGIWEHTGGPAEVIPLLCEHMVLNNAEVSLATLSGPLSKTAKRCSSQGVRLYTYPVFMRQSPWYSRAIKKGLNQLIADADIVHGNGMWEYTNWITAQISLREKKPYLMSFHGSIINYGSWRLKHRIAWKFLDGIYVKKAACLHACTDVELSFIRSLGLQNPVAVIPNGIELWDSISPDAARQLIPEFPVGKNFLYISRIHPQKGIFDLLKSWKSLLDPNSDWYLTIAGPGDPGNIRMLRDFIESNRMQSRTKYLGPLDGEQRTAAYHLADVVVLPSHTENFGLVVGEALACQKPIITTTRVPWPEIVNRKCGWWIEPGVESLTNVLRDVMTINDGGMKEMGRRGKELIISNYTWPKVADMMLDVYKWILGGGAPPMHVNRYKR